MDLLHSGRYTLRLTLWFPGAPGFGLLVSVALPWFELLEQDSLRTGGLFSTSQLVGTAQNLLELHVYSATSL